MIAEIKDTPNTVMDKRIVAFLKSQTNATLATSHNNIPYCASCFYVYVEKLNAMVFKSSRGTKHIEDACVNPLVAGTIIPDISATGKIRGIQFQGFFSKPSDEVKNTIKQAYYKKYPFSLAVDGELWMIELTNIKMVDNTLGFGKKLIWNK